MLYVVNISHGPLKEVKIVSKFHDDLITCKSC